MTNASRHPELIAVDWGTSSFRAYLVSADGAVLATEQSAQGILAVEGKQFHAVLNSAIAPWLTAYGVLPVVMSGMIGSRQGWLEAPYVACPAKLPELARGLVQIEVRRQSALEPRTIAIVPGVMTRTHAGLPDVMRGEETQVIGVMQLLGQRYGSFVLPGTHSKWVSAEDGAIAGFETYMTGEAYAALKDHTILGRLMAAAVDANAVSAGFERGIDAAKDAATRGPGALLQLIFSARTLGLFAEIEPDEIPDYLSELLIGAEVCEAADRSKPVVIIGSDALARRYQAACLRCGLEASLAPSDSAVAGLSAIARAAGLLGNRT